MKNKILKFLPWVLLIAMLLTLIPGLVTRLNAESKNKNIVMSVLYNDIANKVSESSLNDILKQYLDAGITSATVMEEDINMLVARGDVTCIKYNVLKHKYEDENILLAEEIKNICPDVTFDSYVVLVKRPEIMKKFKLHMSDRYTDKECFYVGNLQNMDVYILFDGLKQLWDYAIGYNEETIALLKDMGFEVNLVHKVKNYKKQDYLKYIDHIIKEYDIEYLNLKKDKDVDKKEAIKANYQGLIDIINDNDMTLVVTENPDQLSNQTYFGYDDVFDAVMKEEGGTFKVLRSYETYDDSHAYGKGYEHRVSQHFNSTIDRNIRFVTVTQITSATKSFEECSNLTIKAATEYKKKIEAQGFTVGTDNQRIPYVANGRHNYAACCVIMIMAVLLMLRFVFEKDFSTLTVIALILSAVGYAGTFVLYKALYSLISLYPTLFCLIVSCFAMTAVLYFVKKKKDTTKLAPLTLGAFLLMTVSLFVGTAALATLLSGIDYYINNEIFRGIKLSLLVPVAYTAVIFYLMFMYNKNDNLIKKIPVLLNMEIKVYWIIVGGIIFVIGSYYILRSGNVNSISALESFVRNTLTELFTARPRTKEFLIGYPALILFVYYMKNINIKLFQWLLAIAASILAASVTNSFCHVFTDYSIIASRTLNGLIVGIIVSVIAYVANLILVKLVKLGYKFVLPYLEMK